MISVYATLLTVGVSCSLRRFLDVRKFEYVNLVFPPPALCTDNAAMIAWAGIEMWEAGWESELGCLPLRKWSMDGGADDKVLKQNLEESQTQTTEPSQEAEGIGAGILEVGGWKKRAV